MSVPEVGSLWERDDEVYRVEAVYGAKQRQHDGSLKPVTLVKVILVEPMPWHCNLEAFQRNYAPYDSEAE